MIIGITGYATAGKDSVADIIHKYYDYKKVAFADKLRELALAIDPYICIEEPGQYGYEYSNGIFMRYSEVLNRYGYIDAKKIDDFRRFLQRIGTEGGREVFYNNFWVDALMRVLDKDDSISYVVTDVRFKNEAAAISERGGILWRVTRPGIGPKNDHPSEMEQKFINVDYTINNSGTLSDLIHTVVEAYKKI